MVKFENIRNIRLYESILKQIQNFIKEGKLKTGDKFPSEREMAKQLNVSRASLREAFRVLEMMDVIYCKIGDGRYLKKDLSTFNDSRELMFKLKRAPLLDIWETRLILEVEAVKLVIDRARDEEIITMEKFAEKIHNTNLEEYQEKDYDLEFHVCVAEATHNEVLSEIIIEQMNLLKDLRQKALMDKEYFKQSCEEHISIVKAIKGRDASLASQLMYKHICGIKEAVLTHESI